MESLIGKIRQSERIVLVSHVHPDGDAVGSLLGLTLALQQLGKKAEPYLRDGVASVFQFLEGYEQISMAPLPNDASLCIVLDAAEASRTAYADTIRAYAKRGALAYIDHHPNADLADLTTTQIVDTTASSCAELVLHLIRALGVKITSSITTPILTGMYTDTGGFQFTNTTEETMQHAADLMRRGGRLNKIVQYISHQKSVAHLKLVGIALERLNVRWKGRAGVSVLTHEDMQEAGALDEDLTGVVNELNVLEGIDFILLLTEMQPGEVRGSLRTSDNSRFNVAQLARALGGGGHPRAAGFTTTGTLIAEGADWRIAPFLVSSSEHLG